MASGLASIQHRAAVMREKGCEAVEKKHVGLRVQEGLVGCGGVGQMDASLRCVPSSRGAFSPPSATRVRPSDMRSTATLALTGLARRSHDWTPVDGLRRRLDAAVQFRVPW